jgi:hypothetical protein
MDDLVKQAMAKWPNVPDCYGWLGLDARGNWYMRDERAQACGHFSSGQPGAKGSLLKHEKLIDFIQRNYARDPLGRWYFQNGPQRVFVELEATPWIWRVAHDLSITAHSGESTSFRECFTDENGKVYLETQMGIGLVHTQDVGCVAQAVEQGLWPVAELLATELERRGDYVKSPAATQ